jgi:uncharacterized protein YcaQ
MSEIKIAREQARDFLLRSQMLHGPKLKPGLESVRTVMDHLQTIQVDCISVAGTNQEIALNSRIENFTPHLLDDYLYKSRLGFEYWLKALSIIPMEHRIYFKHKTNELETHHRDFFLEYKKEAKEILKAIEKSGPMTSTDFKDDRKHGGWWGPQERLVKRILENLWDSGKVMIHHRKSRMRYYDLAERIEPVSDLKPSLEEYRRRAVLNMYSAMRLFTTKGGSSELWYGGRSFIRQAHQGLIDDGSIIPVEVEGSTLKLFILREDEAEIFKTSKPDKTIRLIAPLDSMTWNRKLISDIFGFDCTFEVYKPKPKRIYGYYCPFILYGSELVGRFDIAKNPKESVMNVESIFLEPGFKSDSDFTGKLKGELDDYRRFLGMDKMKLPQLKSVKR